METKFLVSLGEKINQIRTQKGLSLYALAALADTSPQRIENIESGSIDASAAELSRIAEALGVKLKDLIAE